MVYMIAKLRTPRENLSGIPRSRVALPASSQPWASKAVGKCQVCFRAEGSGSPFGVLLIRVRLLAHPNKDPCS